MIKNYFKIAWRNLVRHKKITFTNVFGLGVGMAATILIMLWVQNELSFDKDQPDYKRIYRINTLYKSGKTVDPPQEYTAFLIGSYGKSLVPEIEDITRINPTFRLNFHYNGAIYTTKTAAYVDEQWFKFFHYDFIAGSANDLESRLSSVIVSQRAAKLYFGTEDAIGKVIRIDTINYQVQAVVKNSPANSSFQYDLLIQRSSATASARAIQNRQSWSMDYITFAKLKPGANANSVSSKLSDIPKRMLKDHKYEPKYSLLNIANIHFNEINSSFIKGNMVIVKVFMTLAILLLTTACINYVNLTTARSNIRSKEVSIRKIVGAGKLQLFGQFMSESFLVSFFAVILAFLLVQFSMPWYIGFTGKPFTGTASSPVMWLIIGITLTISFLLNGIYPALILSSFNPLNIIRGRALLNLKDTGLRKVLVVIQFAISVILIVGTVVIFRQLEYVEKTNPGYDRSQVFVVSLPSTIYYSKDFEAIKKTIKNELKSSGAILNTAYATGTLVDFGNSAGSGNFKWDGKVKEFDVQVGRIGVDEDFQQLINIKIDQGRWFNGSKADTHNALLNETALNMMRIPKPVLGRRFIHNGDTGVIIGVVKDFNYASFHEKIGPVVINDHEQENATELYIKTAPGDSKKAVETAQTILKKYAPDDLFSYSFLDDYYDNLYRSERQASALITIFATIAVIISALGLLGLVAFAAEQKVKEIGIRKVLGASVRHIVQLIGADFLVLILIAIIIAFPVAWLAMNKWLQTFAYRISLSWVLFAASAGIALFVALVMVSAQAIKAAVANPIESLRNE